MIDATPLVFVPV